jgi:hypothetical protein
MLNYIIFYFIHPVLKLLNQLILKYFLEIFLYLIIKTELLNLIILEDYLNFLNEIRT